MDKEKIVVILLLVTIILSITSIVVTFSLNSESFFQSTSGNVGPSNNAGNINLVLEKQTGGEDEIK